MPFTVGMAALIWQVDCLFEMYVSYEYPTIVVLKKDIYIYIYLFIYLYLHIVLKMVYITI